MTTKAEEIFIKEAFNWMQAAGSGRKPIMVANVMGEPFGFTTCDDDPVLRAIENAPVDDTPETEEERLAVEEGMAQIRTGRFVSHREVQAMIERRRHEQEE